VGLYRYGRGVGDGGLEVGLPASVSELLCSLLLMDESFDLSPLASLAHLHGRVNLVVSCVLFVERGDQVEGVVEDRGDGGEGKVRGCVLRFGGAQSLEHGLHVAERRLD